MIVKAINDTLGPEGTIPSSVGFWKQPQILFSVDDTIPLPTILARATTYIEARKEVDTIIFRLCLNRSLQHDTPAAVYVFYLPGDQLLVWR